jgi:hypothetical protein
MAQPNDTKLSQIMPMQVNVVNSAGQQVGMLGGGKDTKVYSIKRPIKMTMIGGVMSYYNMDGTPYTFGNDEIIANGSTIVSK